MTHWAGYGLPIPDRADNILARLLAAPDLTGGNIIFVAHSLGGLIVEQILRNAERQAGSDKRARDFLSRVRRVAFLGTPHRGAFLATLSKALSLLIRPSDSTRNLDFNGSQLRDLNYWYRKHCRENGIENLILAEGRPSRVFGISLPNVIGKIVSVTSADAGLQETPIIVDQDHKGISKPSDRDAEVYVHLRDFICRPMVTGLKITRTAEALERNTKELETLTARTEEQSIAFGTFTRAIIDRTTLNESRATIIDVEVTRRLERIRKCRFFQEFDPIEQVRSLVASLEEGELASASEGQKGTALAWCARFLSGDNPAEAASILGRITLADSEIISITRSVIVASSGRLQEAISELCGISTPIAYGAAFIQIQRAKGFEEASHWLEKAGLTLADLDSDGKLSYVRMSLEDGCWDIAVEAAKQLGESDWDRSPALIVAAADAFLLQAVPDELRVSVFAQVLPFDLAKFPLRSEPEALEHRRSAMHLYERFHFAAKSHRLTSIGNLMEDKALWLRLVDPESRAEAHQELGESIRDPSKFLRRLGLGLQFNLDIDIEWAEREVDRQTALSGGMSHDAAYARFALALSRGSYASVAAYIDKYREQLLQHLDWRGVSFIEIEVLANAGQTAKAEERLEEATKKGLSEREVARLRRELAEASGGDPIEQRLAAYEANKSIVELRLLVNAYEEAGDWAKVCEYGRTLLGVGGDLTDARRHAISLYRCERHREVLSVMERYPALWTRDGDMRLLRAQTLFECGMLDDALGSVKDLRKVKDSTEARKLQVNLAAVSGDWDSLQGFVEGEWNARCDRTAIDLLRAAKIAHDIGAGRVEELVQEAAKRSPDDASVLAGCYHLASAAGWENSVEVHLWMQKAAELSGPNGPVQVISIEDLFERKPDWERRESSVWEMLERGDAPIFAAGQLLNRSLLSLYLMPILGNMDEADVRRRDMIYAFSRARESLNLNPNIVAMDATALITGEFLDLLDDYIHTFDKIIIPHGTLAWLLGERARIVFHQPSRVVAARELRRMIAEGQLGAFDGTECAPEKLVNDVGPSFAGLVADASSSEHLDGRQRLVVRGGPVYRANTLMNEEADLSEYESYLCSCVTVVRRLAHKGVLTRREEGEACAALAVREVAWPSEPEIADGAVLYLDDLAASHLQFLGLLSKLYRADVTVFVSRSEVEEADALISYNAKANDVVTIVEGLRGRLREGLANGKILLGTAPRGGDKEDADNVSFHPTMELLRLVGNAEVGVVDDRAINQHASISLGNGGRPLLTTVDLLDVLIKRGTISEARRQDALTTLRRANFALTPLTGKELNGLIGVSTINNRLLEETGELRAIREVVQRVRMSNMLQSPKELTWLNGVSQACLFTLNEQWKGGLDEETVEARSDWLLVLSDVRGWSHRLGDNVEEYRQRYRNWILVLMMLCIKEPQEVKEAYWRWFDSRLFEPLEEEDPDTYRYLIQWAKEHVAGSVNACEQSLKSRG